jgi:hypothetical protein
LFRTSAATLLEVAADPKHLGVEVGFLRVLHTSRFLVSCGTQNHEYVWEVGRAFTACGARFPAGPAGQKAGCGQDCPPHISSRKPAGFRTHYTMHLVRSPGRHSAPRYRLQSDGGVAL